MLNGGNLFIGVLDAVQPVAQRVEIILQRPERLPDEFVIFAVLLGELM